VVCHMGSTPRLHQFSPSLPHDGAAHSSTRLAWVAPIAPTPAIPSGMVCSFVVVMERAMKVDFASQAEKREQALTKKAGFACCIAKAGLPWLPVPVGGRLHGHRTATRHHDATMILPDATVKDRFAGKGCGTTPVCRAFTLVEVLALLAVLVILLALLFPTFSSWLALGKQNRCVSNLRAIGSAIHAYAGDNNGRLPGPGPNAILAQYSRGNFNDPRQISHFLLPYFGLSRDTTPATGTQRVAQFLCPAALEIMSEDDLASGICYGKVATRYNGEHIVIPNQRTLADGQVVEDYQPFGARSGGGPADNPAFAQPLRMSQILQPSRTIAIMDRVAVDPEGKLTAHGGHRNFLLMDGHVRRVPLDQILSANELKP